MNKPDLARQLKKDIAALEVRAAERKRWCMNNVHASNYDEVSADYRAITVKISAKKQQLNELNSSVKVLEKSVRITPGINQKYARV